MLVPAGHDSSGAWWWWWWWWWVLPPQVAGFPNLFTVTGPGSPSVLSNMLVSIEQHVEWIADCLAAMAKAGNRVIEPTEQAEAGWIETVNRAAEGPDGPKILRCPCPLSPGARRIL